jgi:hypothetical protein
LPGNYSDKEEDIGENGDRPGAINENALKSRSFYAWRFFEMKDNYG